MSVIELGEDCLLDIEGIGDSRRKMEDLDLNELISN
jgi:hypothetical protein